MNLDYLKPGATIPITAEAIRYLIDIAKQLQSENNFLKDWRDTWSPYVNQLKQTKSLSDEEIKVIATQNRADLTIPAYISFARLIEEKIKEKNGN